MRTGAVLLLAALVLTASACGEEKLAPAPGSGSADTTTDQRPSSFSQTRDSIRAAVKSGDYEALRPLLVPETFLSDFGFGEERDPVGRWEEMGSGPLDTMGVLLQMKPVVRETNEGTLHQWPGYDADSDPGDLTMKDRDLFRSVMSKDELDRLITDDYGYTGPKLGILEDGIWWFFILKGGP
jgi:hypothetical protein